MSNRTIAKFLVFVISITGLIAGDSGCGEVASRSSDRKASAYQPPEVVGTITSEEITEGSGIAPSRCQPNVLWTHNDSGDGPFIFAVNQAGQKLGTWQVTGAENIDWEDIATIRVQSGQCLLFIGEIGNNEATKHPYAIYRIAEPVVSPGSKESSEKRPVATDRAEVLRFAYPDGEHNAEGLMVHPSTSDIYVITKHITGPAGVYLLKAAFDETSVQKAVHVTNISLPSIPNGLVTGGAISPDGRHAIVCDYSQAYEYSLPDNAAGFDDIWRQEPTIVNIGRRKHGESVGYSADGNAIFATSEGLNSPVIRVERAQ